ncbi:hypothetical protein Bbelb_211860 [Branchiostoma belcheri]|nr:hypothetical protein Bbelb_211860 [Branchiostoma belcheri]
MLIVQILTVFAVVVARESSDTGLSKLISLGCDVEFYSSFGSVSKLTCDNKGLMKVPEEVPTEVHDLSFPNNALTTFPCVKLVKLNAINLRNNSISHFSWKCLKKFPYLNRLDLSQNQIFCVNLFPVKSALRFLRLVNISYNRLTTFASCDLGIDMLKGSYDKLYTAIVWGNPFHCDCDIANYGSYQPNVTTWSSLPTTQSKAELSWTSTYTQALGMTEMTQALNMTEMTQALNMTDLEMTKALGMTEMTQGLDMTAMTQALNLTEMTQAPDMTEMTQALNMTEMTQALNMTEMTQALNMTEMTQALGTTEMTQALNMTEMTQALNMTKMTLGMTTSQAVVVASGWILTIIMAVLAVPCVVCGVAVAVYWVRKRLRDGNSAPLAQVNNMATGQVSSNILYDPKQITHVGDSLKTDTESDMYETIPD